MKPTCATCAYWRKPHCTNPVSDLSTRVTGPGFSCEDHVSRAVVKVVPQEYFMDAIRSEHGFCNPIKSKQADQDEDE